MASNLTLTCPDFATGDPIPRRCTCDGANVSPRLSWYNAPEGARSFVLVMDDPDAPRGLFTHWLVYDIPADTDALEADLPAPEELPGGIHQGTTSFGNIGYGGPCPPEGDEAHRYFFRLYALDTELNLGPGASREQLFDAMQGHVLANTEIFGTYQRQRGLVGS